MKRKPIQVDWKKNTLKTFVEALHKIFIYVFFFLRECNFWYSTMTCFESFCDFTQCIWNLDVSSVKWKTDWWPLCSLQAWLVFCLAMCCFSFYIKLRRSSFVQFMWCFTYFCSWQQCLWWSPWPFKLPWWCPRETCVVVFIMLCSS